MPLFDRPLATTRGLWWPFLSKLRLKQSIDLLIGQRWLSHPSDILLAEDKLLNRSVSAHFGGRLPTTGRPTGRRCSQTERRETGKVMAKAQHLQA